MLYKYITLLRPKQYIKNLFVFMPLFFSGQFTNLIQFKNTLYAFVLFSMAASSIYILNDMIDVKADQIHPIKKERPIASGAITLLNAFLLFLALASLTLFISFQWNKLLFIIILSYIILNIFYSIKIKYIALLDISSIAIGFVLRLFAGSVVDNIVLSKWIVLMTFLLSLFLALAKRRDDILISTVIGKKIRKSIDGYSLNLIDSAMQIMSSVVIVTYILYTTSLEVVVRLNNDYIYLSSFFVILGILRYLQLTLISKESGSPTKLVLKDKFLQIDIILWVLFFIGIIYL